MKEKNWGCFMSQFNLRPTPLTVSGWGLLLYATAEAWLNKEAAFCPTCHAWSEDLHTFLSSTISASLNTLQGYALLLADTPCLVSHTQSKNIPSLKVQYRRSRGLSDSLISHDKDKDIVYVLKAGRFAAELLRNCTNICTAGSAVILHAAEDYMECA